MPVLTGGGKTNTGGFMNYLSMKNLLEAGVHFGHQIKRWNPKMQKYVFGKRNGIYIIDLQKTVQCFNQAYEFARDMAKQDATFLFVGTKKQANEAIKDAAEKSNSFYMYNRWLGGTLTNFKTIISRVERMKELEEMITSGHIDRYKKKEAATYKREFEKLKNNLYGIKDMNRVPDVMFIIDIKRESNAVHEAKLLDIPIIAVVDTNCDPTDIDFPIPGNDDAIRACQLLSSKIANAIMEGKQLREAELIEEINRKEKLEAETEAETSIKETVIDPSGHDNGQENVEKK